VARGGGADGVEGGVNGRRTIDASDRPAVVGGMKARNNGRYNGNGRHWETPPEVFDPLHREFAFTLDVCAQPSTAKVARFYQEPGPWLDQGGEWNALDRSWAGERAWMNPPYGAEIYAWTQKARIESAAGALVVGLLPASTDLAWWHDDVLGHAEIVKWYRGRIRFLTGGPYRASGFFPSVAVAWRPGGAS
jgi:phage N-6-adenine-methyltransferase